jgi:hypothetical protein
LRVLRALCERIVVVLTACTALAVACAHTPKEPQRSRLDGAKTWWIMIGHLPNPLNVDWSRVTDGVDVAVIDGDAGIPVGEWNPRTLRLAYLSVGEANPSRRSWAAVKHQA